MMRIGRYDIGVTKRLKGLVIVLLMLSLPAVLAKNAVSSEGDDQLLKYPEKIPALLDQNEITEKQIPNPHWRTEGCVSCHAGKASRANKNLRTGNINNLCNSCHKTNESHSIIHPVGVLPSKKMLSRMPEDFREVIKRSNGKINCLTCHDVVQACGTDRENSHLVNPRFFRGEDYREDRTRLCFNCHDDGQYKRLNPHKQVRKDGTINKGLCYICHEDVPDVRQVTGMDQLDFNIEDDYSSVEDNYSSMCNGCHPWKPHPGGSFSFQMKVVDHLVMPSDKVMRQLKQSPIYLPLEPGTQRVFCGTCHNAHEKGVIKRTAANQGASSKHFLRDQNLCINCHEK